MNASAVRYIENMDILVETNVFCFLDVREKSVLDLSDLVAGVCSFSP